MKTLKTFLALAVVATAIASPAFAQKYQPYGSNTVTSGNRVLGTDPDPNVRFDLQREQNWRNGGY